MSVLVNCQNLTAVYINNLNDIQMAALNQMLSENKRDTPIESISKRHSMPSLSREINKTERMLSMDEEKKELVCW